MNKNEFLTKLRQRIYDLPEIDINQWCDYYSEMIDDRVEDGLSEQEAINDLGGVEAVASQILKEIPMPQLIMARFKPRHELKAWQIVLIILGAPLWIPLIATVVAVVLTIYAALWSVLISLYAAAISIIGTAVACFACTGVYFYLGKPIGALVFLSAALILAGLSILSIIGCNIVLKYFIILSKKLWLVLKGCFVKKEAAR